MEDGAQVDPEVLEALTHIRDRHGPKGLRDLIALAQEELARTEAAVAELAQWEARQNPPGSTAVADPLA